MSDSISTAKSKLLPNRFQDKIASPDSLLEDITTDQKSLWEQNEALFLWILTQASNFMLQTVPGGGKSYCKEKLVPQIASESDQTFVLATTEHRNRQETYKKVLETMIAEDLIGNLEVVYIPSAYESYGDIPQLGHTDSGREVTYPDDDDAVCQTFTQCDGELKYSIAGKLEEYIKQGASTSSIHNIATQEWKNVKRFPYENGGIDYSESPLECQRIGVEEGYDPDDPEDDPACRYRRLMKDCIEDIGDGRYDIIICGASHLNISTVVEDAVVIADEDVAGELYNTYTQSYFDNAVEQFLTSVDVGPDTAEGILRREDKVKRKMVSHIRDNYAPKSKLDDDDDRDPLINPNAPIKPDSYDYNYAEAPLLTLAELEAEPTENTKHAVYDSEECPYTVAIDQAASNEKNSHDEIAVANTPQPLQEAKQVIALDATGKKKWWETLLGVDFEVVSPNPPEKRGHVAAKAFNIEFRALTDNMVPISSPKNVSSRGFLGILQSIVHHHDADEISIVTSKRMRNKVLDSEYAEQVKELAYADEILYFQALRSDRTFEDSHIHVVIGAPHPGDDPIRQRMAILGYDDKILSNEENPTVSGEDRYKGKAKDTLQSVVYSEVYQAARRASRTDSDEQAYVYLYTSMYDDNDFLIDDSYTVDIVGKNEKVKGGSAAILNALDEGDELMDSQDVLDSVNRRINGELSPNRIREKLNNLSEIDIVSKQSGFGKKNQWKLVDSVRYGVLEKEP